MKLHRPCERSHTNPRMTIDDISDVYLHECVRMCVRICVGRVVVIVVVLVSVCRVCMCLNVCVRVYQCL